VQSHRKTAANLSKTGPMETLDLNEAPQPPPRHSTPEGSGGARARRQPATCAGHALLPRLIRLRDAPYFFGMDKNRFNPDHGRGEGVLGAVPQNSCTGSVAEENARWLSAKTAIL
jgi:hypothetical protein